VKELCESDGVATSEDDPHDKIPAAALKLAKVAQATNTTSPQDLARALLQQEGDVSLARARLQAMRRLLGETEKLLVE
jgi:hypothetical protein